MSIGAQLRTAREAKGLSLGAVAQRTRVQPRTLVAIELNDLSLLPPRPFGRGFVRAYAQEVDLDPDRTVREYFAQFPGDAETSTPVATHAASPPSWVQEPDFGVSSRWTGLAAALATLVLVVVAALIVGRRSETARETNAVGTTGAGPSAPASVDTSTPAAGTEKAKTPSTLPAASAPPDAARSPASSKLALAFTVTRPCWVTATADGQRAVYRTLQPGDRETVNAEREIAIRFGDAGAVSWTINGRQGDALGTSGAVRDLRITPENAASVR